MSWDATLYVITETAACPECGHALDPPKRSENEAGAWNYTHNVAGMLDTASVRLSDEPTWWKRLDGMTGPESAVFLGRTIRNLEADPERYRAMNPENGWGSYDSLLKVLREMQDAIPEGETTIWHVSG